MSEAAPTTGTESNRAFDVLTERDGGVRLDRAGNPIVFSYERDEKTPKNKKKNRERLRTHEVLRSAKYHPSQREAYDMGFEDAGGTIPWKTPAEAAAEPEATPAPGTVVTPAAAAETTAAGATEATDTPAAGTGEGTTTPEPTPEPTPSPEPTAERPTEAAETGGEFYHNKDRWINPDRVRELKQQFQQSIERAAVGVRGVNSLRELRELDPHYAASIEELERSRLLFDYFETSPERGRVPEELRNDVIHLMSLSDGTLRRLTLRPEGAEPTPTPEPTPEPIPTPEPTPTPTPRPGVIGAGAFPGRATETTPEADEPGTTPEERTRWQRLKDWLRSGKLGAPVPVHNFMIGAPVFREEDPSLSEEEREELREKRRNRRALGALALFGGGVVAGAILGYLLGNDDGSKDAVPGNGGQGAPKGDGIESGGEGDLFPDGDGAGVGVEITTGPDGHHTEVYNKEHGDRTVQSILPENLKQEPVPGEGYEHIVDKKTGEEIEDHVTYGESGRYSVDTNQDLAEEGYKVRNIPIELHDTTGLGPRGDITHQVSVVAKPEDLANAG